MYYFKSIFVCFTSLYTLSSESLTDGSREWGRTFAAYNGKSYITQCERCAVVHHTVKWGNVDIII